MRLSLPTRHATRWLILLGLGFCLTLTLVAQTTCDALSTGVLDAVKQICSTSERDFVCYGNILVEAQPQAGVTTLNFERPGDRVNVVNVKSLQLSPLDLLQGTWGVAQLRLIPTTARHPDDDLVMLFFGDVTVQNQTVPRDTFDFMVTSQHGINLRNFPSLDSTVLGLVEPAATLRALGRLEDGSWLRVQKMPFGTVGWISTDVLEADDLSRVDTLLVEGSSDPYYGPMQAIYFQSGDPAENDCGTPSNGMLIQTPEGVARVTVLINEVTFDFVSNGSGATAFIQAQPNGDMQVRMLEGAAYVGAGNTRIYLPPGSQLTIPMNSNLAPDGAPSLPVPNDGTGNVAPLYPALDRAPAVTVWQPSSSVPVPVTNTDTTSPTTSVVVPGSNVPENNLNSNTVTAPGSTGGAPDQVVIVPDQSGTAPTGTGGSSSGGGSTPPESPGLVGTVIGIVAGLPGQLGLFGR